MYYNSLFAKVVTDNWSTSVFPFLVGVFQGCTISPILVDIVFQLCMKYVEENGSEPYAVADKQFNITSRFGIVQLLQQAYADDHALANRSIRGAQLYIDLVSRWLYWTRCMAATSM